jgi:hypothetical protein
MRLPALAVAVATGLLTLTGTAAADTGGCTDGPWQVAGASVEGRPPNLDAGDLGRTYLWHDGDGWHLRTTDIHPDAHQYTGTVVASPGARFVDVHPVRLDPADRLWVDDHQVLHYSFVTHAGIDGIDFRVTGCDASLAFRLRKNGRVGPDLVDLGAERDHPRSDPFVATR